MNLSQLFSFQSFTIATLLGSGSILARADDKGITSDASPSSENSSTNAEMDNSSAALLPQPASLEFHAIMARHRATDFAEAMRTASGQGAAGSLPSSDLQPRMGDNPSPISTAMQLLASDRVLGQAIETPTSVAASQPTSNRVADSAGDVSAIQIVRLAGR